MRNDTLVTLRRWGLAGIGLSAALIGAGAFLPAQAGPPREAEISNKEITASEITAHVRYLASPELAGRGSGTPGNDRAAEYIASRFKSVGLRPAGERKGFFQSFPVFKGVKLGKVNTLRLDLAGKKQDLPVEKEYMPLAQSKNGAAAGEVVFAGYGISRPDLGYDDYKDLNVQGKIVLVLRASPDDAKFGVAAQINTKTMTAREKGAAGILLATGPLTEQEENLGVFRLDSAAADAGICGAIIRRGHAEKLVALAGKKLEDLQVAMAHGQTQSMAIPGARAEIGIHIDRQMGTTRNVVGLLEGSDPRLREEVIVVGAHFDHLGHGGSHSLSPSSKPEIHPGADDNASGTTGVIELAQYFAAHRERLGRSVLFMAFSGEEIGLLGSAHWTKNPTIPLGRVVAMVNMDMIGRMKSDTVFVLGSKTSSEWDGILREASARDAGLVVKSDSSTPFGSSDQQSFYAKKLPVLFFFTGLHPDYHRPSDTWDKVNAEGTARILRLVADVLERAGRSPQRLAFTPLPEAAPARSGSFRVYLGTIPDYAATVEGVTLQGVREGGPAEKAGLKAGDVIVEFAGKKIRNVEEYTVVLSEIKPGVPVAVVVLRGSDRLTLTLIPASRAN